MRTVREQQFRRDRCLYWAVWGDAPDGARVPVSYRIAGEGSGSYLRPKGPPLILYRWDNERSAGSSLDADGVWRPSEAPARTVLLGSDYGHPVTVSTARKIAAHFGVPDALEDFDVHPL